MIVHTHTFSTCSKPCAGGGLKPPLASSGPSFRWPAVGRQLATDCHGGHCPGAGSRCGLCTAADSILVDFCGTTAGVMRKFCPPCFFWPCGKGEHILRHLRILRQCMSCSSTKVDPDSLGVKWFS